jgi:formylglycine-generating enzyme required for sulfatase activity
VVIGATLSLLATGSLVAAERGIGVVEVLGKDAALPRYHALVIGINDYQHWPDLRQARQDAEKTAKLLRSRYGFGHVRALYDKDATREGIQRELRQYAKTLTRKDALLIYFAGHGYYDKLLKKGYWVPAEARETADNEPAVSDWLDNTVLRDYLKAMEARHVLVVSDSCFSGALFRGGRVNLSAKENTWYRKAIAQPSRWGISSGDLETVPDQSVFARKFLQVLEYPKRSVFSASDLCGWLKVEVAANSQCQPVFGPLDDPGNSADGEFVFIVEEGETTPEPPVIVTPAPVTGPQTITLTGSLVVKSPQAGTVTIDGGQGYAIGEAQGLKWDLPVGPHQVRVRVGSDDWQQTVAIKESQTVTITAVFGGRSGATKTLDLGRGVKLELVWIPAGEFMMGSPAGEENRGRDETQHRVTISQGFWMGKTEVTQEQYEAVMGTNPSKHKAGDKPVHNVSWNDVTAFCQRVGQGVRLPTEAEWEYACRAGTTTKYSSGDTEADLRRVADYGRNYAEGPGAVGQKEANPWGLYDTHGNVWEWCADWYGDYPNGEVTDPTGPSSGSGRVLRGGSFYNEPGYCRCANRLRLNPDLTLSYFGFRVVVGLSR